MSEIQKRLRRVRYIVCDVDGVLTDGLIPFDADGRPCRTIHARDATALTLWRLAGGQSALVSGLGSKALETIAATWKCAELHMWIKDKATICLNIAARNDLSMDDLAFIGDDIIDLSALSIAGLAVAVQDAAPEAKSIAHIVTEAPGGYGALREVVFRILKAQGRLEDVLELYCSRTNENHEH